MENNNDDNDEGYFLEVDVKYSEKLHDPPNVYHFYLKEWKFKNWENFYSTWMTKYMSCT